jgi:hypothetical protein
LQVCARAVVSVHLRVICLFVAAIEKIQVHIDLLSTQIDLLHTMENERAEKFFQKLSFISNTFDNAMVHLPAT